MVFSFSAEGQSTEIPEVTTSAPSIPSQSRFLFGSASEVALNKGYFQEQMAIRDEAMSIRDETISSMQEEISMLRVG